jgi:hypothetical protein
MGIIFEISILVINAGLLLFGLYLKSYFSKKGEYLATKEDFKDLKAQTAELRQTTKEIEAKIDDQVWDRQRQWEMKRDILLEATKRLTEATDAVYAWASEFRGEKKQPNQERSGDLARAVDRWVKGYDEYGSSVALVELVCTEEVISPLKQLADHLGDLNDLIHQDRNAEHEVEQLDDLIKEAKAAIRISIRR